MSYKPTVIEAILGDFSGHNFARKINETPSTYVVRPCAIWSLAEFAATVKAGENSQYMYSSKIGGVYERALGEHSSDLSEEEMVKASRLVVLANNNGDIPRLVDILEQCKSPDRPSYVEQIDRLLRYIQLKSVHATRPIEIGVIDSIHGYGEPETRIEPISAIKSYVECIEDWDFELLLQDARDDGFIKFEPHPDDETILARLTRKGHERLEGLVDNELSEQAFVAMWFHDSMNEPYRHISEGISLAGYVPYRVDKDNKSDDQITNEILAQIRRSKFLVADFSSSDGVRGGVYFEAGFALGLGIGLLFTVREEDLEALHFDTRQYPHIIWNPENLDSLKLDVQSTIEARFGRGPVKNAF